MQGTAYLLVFLIQAPFESGQNILVRRHSTNT